MEQIRHIAGSPADLRYGCILGPCGSAIREPARSPTRGFWPRNHPPVELNNAKRSVFSLRLRIHTMKTALLLALLLPVVAAAGDKRIVVIAHRGEHLHHIENTLPAFQAAIEAGADYLECDVRTTSC
jgi:hypothetical protein